MVILSLRSRALYAGHKALVVGASGGIGSAIADELLRGGADVVLTYSRNRSRVECLQNFAVSSERSCLLVQMDLADSKSVTSMCADVNKHFGTPSILINCAGIRIDKPLMSMSLEDWDHVLQVNLRGPFVLMQEVGRMMLASRNGRIINIGSLSAEQAITGQANYSASKAGLAALTKVAAREFGPFGITVNAIAPGLIDTEMTKYLPPETKRTFMSRTPLRRIGQPSDLLPIVRALLAPGSSYITGQILTVDGGLSA